MNFESKVAPMECRCGTLITNVSHGYGRVPYHIWCPKCKVGLHDYMPNGVGWQHNEDRATEAFVEFSKAVKLTTGTYGEINYKKLAEYWYREFKKMGHYPGSLKREEY